MSGPTNRVIVALDKPHHKVRFHQIPSLPDQWVMEEWFAGGQTDDGKHRIISHTYHTCMHERRLLNFGVIPSREYLTCTDKYTCAVPTPPEGTQL